MNKSYRVAFSAVAVACFAAIFATQARSAAPTASTAAPQAPGIMGTIKDRSGKALGGVTVSARSAAQTFATSVYTDERGVYVFPNLSAGSYKIWAQAVGFTTERADLTLDGSHTVKRDLTLKPLADFGPQLTGFEWFNSLPDDSAEHQRIKQVMYVACTGCHSLDLPLQNTFDEAGWNAIVKSMENSFYNGYVPGDLQPAQMRWEGQIIRRHRDELAKYLAEVRGPQSPPLTLKPLPRPSGDAARAVVTEYELPLKETLNDPSWYTGTDWMLGPSTGMHGAVGIHDVILDAAGTAWITQSRTTFETNRSLVKLDPTTGEAAAYRVDGPDGRIMFFEQVATPDAMGNIWMHAGGSLVRLEPKTEAFTLFPLPRVMGGMENSTDVDSKGRVVVNGRYGVVQFDPAERNRTDVAYAGWHLYQQLTPGDGTTYGVTADAEDNLWWSESYADKVATRDMKTGKVVEFDMRDPDYDARKALATPADLAFYDSIGAGTWSSNSASPLPYANMPRRLSADKNGDTVWVPNWAQSNIAEINIHTHKVTYHRLPIRVHPYKTTVDKQHNVWTDTSLADAVWRFTPSTGAWTMFRLPSHGCGSRHISFDDYKGELWLPCDQSNKVIRFQFRTADDIRALAAAARAGH
jgi:streptogramin lyase